MNTFGQIKYFMCPLSVHGYASILSAPKCFTLLYLFINKYRIDLTFASRQHRHTSACTSLQIAKLATHQGLVITGVSITEQTGLSLTWSEERFS